MSKEERKGAGARSPKERLEDILSGKATVGALDAYFDQAIEKLTALIKDARSAYEKDPRYDASLPGRDQEDRAFEAAGLPDVGEVLDALTKKRDAYRELVQTIAEQNPDPDLVFLPGNGDRAVYGSERPKRGEQEEVGRMQALAFVLAELGLTKGDIGGALAATKERGTGRRGYTVVDVPALNRAVLVSNERAQATYVIDTGALQKLAPPRMLEDVIQLSKDDLRKLLEENKDKGVGTWLKFTDDTWMDRLKFALTSPHIGKEEIRSPDDETQIIDTAGPWEGFVDVEGFHYGTPEAIRKRLKSEEGREESLALVGSVCRKLTSVPITDPRITPRKEEDGYAYETFREALTARDALPKVDRTTGMALVGPDRLTYMSLDLLAKYLGRSQDAIEALIKRQKITPVLLLDKYNRETNGYPVERLRDLSDLTMKKPQVEMEGTDEIPKGFIEKDGKLFGLVKEISRKLSVSESSINQAIHQAEASGTPLPSLEVRDYSNNPRTAYELSSIEQHPIVARILKAEDTDADGWLRKDGKTYGTIPKIAGEIIRQELVSITEKQLANKLGHLARGKGLFEARPARVPNVRPVQDVYCLEDIIAYLKKENAS